MCAVSNETGSQTMVMDKGEKKKEERVVVCGERGDGRQCKHERGPDLGGLG